MSFNGRIISDRDINKLRNLVPDGVCIDVELSKISRWKIGGVADCILSPGSVDQLRDAVSYLNNKNIPFVPFSRTTNLLFSDYGLRAVGIYIGKGLSQLEFSVNRVKVGGGVWAPYFAREVSRCGFSGVEHVCGIPASMGGLVYMNGGSQRKSVSENIKSVISVGADGALVSRTASECEFGYRKSIFQSLNEIIVEAEFEFKLNELLGVRVIRKRMKSILKSRRQKFPNKYPNCGSVFKSRPDMYQELGPPGKVLEDLGCKGMQIGGAVVSERHANFINNVDGASANDVRRLVSRLREVVLRETGYILDVEPQFLNEYGVIENIEL